MRHKYPVLTVKQLLKSESIYGSYRKNKIGVPFFGPPCRFKSTDTIIVVRRHLLQRLELEACGDGRRCCLVKAKTTDLSSNAVALGTLERSC